MRDDTPIRRLTRKPATNYTPYIIGGGLVLACVVAFLIGVIVRANRSGNGVVAGGGSARPSAQNEGVKWGYDELVAYLNSRGLDCYHDTSDGGMFGMKMRVIVSRKQIDDFRRTSDLNAGVAIGCLRVESIATAMRESASLRNGFSWGRFVFFDPDGHNNWLSLQIRSTLR